VLFNSYEFLFAFLPLTLVICFALARLVGPGAAQLWLIAASFYFYASWNLQYLPLLLGSILFNYTIARLMRRAPEPRRPALLALGIAVDLALLGYYKYTNYFIDSLNSLSHSQIFVANILLPLGISFYTFQQITLLVDMSGPDAHAPRLRDFALFVIFFPHLIAGPIVHHREMMPQFRAASWRYNSSNMAVGLTLFAAGLFKKAVLADGIAAAIAPIYADAAAHQPISFLYAWAGIVGFTLQMYFDFSGYSEMALGLARTLGITLPMNFNSPLKAASIIEYWSCWHMTLTRFLTGYLYNPMAMSITRWRRARRWPIAPGPRGSLGAAASIIAAPTIATMLISGLWHGAGNQYIVFGALHGSYLVTNHAWRLYRPRRLGIPRPLGVLVTFIVAAMALTYFHASGVRAGTDIIAGAAGLHGLALPDVIASRLPSLAAHLAQAGITFAPLPLPPLLAMAAWILALLAIALLLPNLLQIMAPWQPAITLPLPYGDDRRIAPLAPLLRHLAWRPTPFWAAAAAAVSACAILALNHVTAFLYWQF